jgi:hypothetical protein
MRVVDLPPLASQVLTVAGIVLLAVCAVLVLLQSPLSPGSIRYPGSESSLYLYAGSQLLDGTMIYRDIFDYHGPLVFLINALGLLVGEPLGVWLLEAHFLIITLIIIFLMLCRHTGPLTALPVSLVFLALVGGSLQGGNQWEEYALLFQVLALIGFVDSLTKNRFTLLSVYLIGLSGALTFCLEPALTVFWMPFLLVIFIMLLRKEGLGMALTKMVAVLFSASLVFIVMLPWLHLNNALTSCLDQMLFYYRDCLSVVTGQERLEALRYFIERPVFVLIVFISLAAIVKLVLVRRGRLARHEDDMSVLQPVRVLSVEDEPFGRNTGILIATNLFAALLVFLMMAVPGRADEQLVLQGLICLVIPLTYVIHRFVRSFFSRAWLRMALGVVAVALLALVLVVPSFNAVTALAQEQRESDSGLVEQRELVNEIRSYREYDEPIIVFGNDCWVYTASGSYSATRYAYQPFGPGFRSIRRPDLTTGFYRQVKIAESTLLVGRVGEHLVESYPGIHDYELVFENRRYELYRRIEEPEEVEETSPDTEAPSAVTDPLVIPSGA